jgi:hypothetical protein
MRVVVLVGLVVTQDACRIGFDVLDRPSDAAAADAAGDTSATDAATDAMPDAGPDAPGARVVMIDAAPHHLGDSQHSDGVPMDPEGASWGTSFALTLPCNAATLKLTFTGPYGPHVADPPVTLLNGVDLGSVIPFFSNCASDCDDFSNGDVLVSLPADTAVADGTNTLSITTGRPDDDFYFRDVELHCGP